MLVSFVSVIKNERIGNPALILSPVVFSVCATANVSGKAGLYLFEFARLLLVPLVYPPCRSEDKILLLNISSCENKEQSNHSVRFWSQI